MSGEKLTIEFWEDENGDMPVGDFMMNLPEKIRNQIEKKLNNFKTLDFDEMIHCGDKLTIIEGYEKVRPKPYEVKFKSQKVRMMAYRKNSTLFLVEAVIGSFTNKKLLNNALRVYQNRVN